MHSSVISAINKKINNTASYVDVNTNYLLPVVDNISNGKIF